MWPTVTCRYSQLLIESIDDLQMESHKLQHYDRNLQRQKAAQQQYLLKKKMEAQARLAKGEEPLPEEDLSQNQVRYCSLLLFTALLLPLLT